MMKWSWASRNQAEVRRLVMSGIALLLVGIPGLVVADTGQAQVVPNVGDAGTVVTPNGNVFTITGGAMSPDQVNLFHSFLQFGLSRDQIADFIANPTLQNILVRVNGGNASVIDGLLRVSGGNSNLYFMNPSGIIFGTNARLDVPGSFTATTANGIGFGAGWFSAAGANDYGLLVGSPSNFAFAPQAGAVINAGSLTVGAGQSLRLLGGIVVNTGDLTVPGGEVTVAAVPGSQVVRLSQPGDVLGLQIQTSSAGGTSPNAWNFPVAALPQLLTGAGVGVPTGLTVAADGTVQVAGRTVPTAAGTSLIAGTLNASSSSLSSSSQVNVLGSQVSLVGAQIDASGANGGGLVRIGGDYQGKGAMPNALQTFVSADSVITADALTSGNGGRVMVWANDSTEFLGSISARGGSQTGNGGFAEVSGKQTLIFNGKVDLSSPNGNLGTLLLDPTDILISNGSDSGTTITQASLQSLQFDANVILEATNDIKIGTLSGNQLTFAAAPGGSSGATAVGKIKFSADSDGDGRGVFLMNLGDTISASGRSIEILGASITAGNIETSTPPDVPGGNITLTATSGNITTGNLDSGANVTANRSLANQRADGGAITVSAISGSVSTGRINSSARSSLGNDSKGGDINISARNGINVQSIRSASSSLLGNGGDVTINSLVEGITIKESIRTGGGGGNDSTAGKAGNVAIISQGDIKGDEINTYSAGSGAAGNVSLISRQGSVILGSIDAGSSNGSGGIITTTVGKNIEISDFLFTRSGSLADPDSRLGNGSGGGINLKATGNISIGQIFSGSFNGNGGNINIQANGSTTLTDYASSRVSLDSRSSGNGNSGNITLKVGESITTKRILSSSANGNAGAIDIQVGKSINLTGFLDSGSRNGNGGSIILKAGDSITTQSIDSTSSTRNGGAINIEAGRNISLVDSLSSGSRNGNGGSIILKAGDSITTQSIDSTSSSRNGGAINIEAGKSINLASFLDSGSFGNGSGGNIILKAGGSITTKELFSSSLNGNGNGGSVTLDPPNDIQVSFIDAQGGPSGKGGDVFVITNRFFRATDTFTDQNGIQASISTAGGIPGSSIIIAHGGNGIIPFTVGNLSENGTAGAITTGLDNIIAPDNYLYTYRQTAPSGDIQIISVPRPPEGLIVPPLALATTLPCSSAVMAAVEGKFAQQYEKSLGSRLARKTVLDACEVLRGIQARIGINPAIIYAVFVPPEVKPPDFQVSAEQSDDDYLALILVTPAGGTYFPVRSADKYVRRQEVRAVADEFWRSAIDFGDPDSYKTPGSKLYRWLIETVKTQLTDQKIDNLTFILDEHLRQIPLAALYDGKTGKHLVEQYSLGMMPSLNLTDTRYAPIQNASILAIGRSDFSNANRSLANLLTVPTEIDLLTKRVWNRSGNAGLLDPDFQITPQSLATESKKGFGIIHISSHAQFNAEATIIPRTPEQIARGQIIESKPRTLHNSFIQLSGTEVLTLDQFRTLGLDTFPRELLVLSACETALGDPQAELGFAGIATQADVKSALGSLWSANEGGALALVTEFYQQLGKPGRIKAEALRQAQLQMLNSAKQDVNPVRLERTATGLDLVWSGGRVRLPEGTLPSNTEIPDYRHPYYWASFTLIGSPW